MQYINNVQLVCHFLVRILIKPCIKTMFLRFEMFPKCECLTAYTVYIHLITWREEIKESDILLFQTVFSLISLMRRGLKESPNNLPT